MLTNQVYVELKKLPSWSKMNDQVNKLVSGSSWWDLYGVDWGINSVAFLGFLVGHLLVGADSWLVALAGVLLLAVAHCILTAKSGHLAAHNALAHSKACNYFWLTYFVEFMGNFSVWAGLDIHIKNHHPHTNIVGLGDSSTWKVPFLPRGLYMFVAPLAFPLITPLVALQLLVESAQWLELVKCLVVMALGTYFHIYLLLSVSGLSLTAAVLTLWAYRAMFSIPYIHINIFQHIGLPMYSPQHRPARVYQMSTGVLNLSRNALLDLLFGHSLVNCHVEHHLFPRLSDNMCLKVKPLVRQALLEHGLPYHETSYYERLTHFLSMYEQLMVNAPPITHFVGIQ